MQRNLLRADSPVKHPALTLIRAIRTLEPTGPAHGGHATWINQPERRTKNRQTRQPLNTRWSQSP